MVRTERLAPGAYKAEIRNGQRVLAWAVEATAADAVAFAALAATGYAQAGRHGTAHLNGAAPDTSVRDREEAFQQTLANLPGVHIEPLQLDPELRSAGLKAYK